MDSLILSKQKTVYDRIQISLKESLDLLKSFMKT